MTLQLLYWILMLIWLLGGFVPDTSWRYWPTARNLLLFMLLLILGIAEFGGPIKG